MRYLVVMALLCLPSLMGCRTRQQVVGREVAKRETTVLRQDSVAEIADTHRVVEVMWWGDSLPEHLPEVPTEVPTMTPMRRGGYRVTYDEVSRSVATERETQQLRSQEADW